ncbi:MAG: response regulator transcription factor [Pseudomonadota bacterium]
MAVFIVSRVHMVRDILESTCEHRKFVIGAICSKASELTDLQDDDVVVLHTRRAPSAMASQITYLRTVCPGVRIVLIIPESAVDTACSLLGDEVQAIMPEDYPTEALIGALAVVMQGYRVARTTDCISDPAAKHRSATGDVGEVANTVKKAGDTKNNAGHAPAPWENSVVTAPLSPREDAVLRKLREGGSNKDIAKELGICEATVKVYLRTCFQKIGVKNRTQAAVWASERL